MQISHESDKIAQATFGTKSSRTARMADSAAFYHILSASLYSNPLLAAIREIVCNADDAHQQAGVTEPVQITVGELEGSQGEMLVVRDFGHGIPDDKMVDIYLVFGESTKKDDSGATGGFGLGSKAPWAVVDQFFVTSNHNGTKTIYTLVKSDPDNDGRPSIQVMFRGPTTDTGLEVRVPIVGSTSTSEVVAYIKGVVFYSGIHATLKDTSCRTKPNDLPFLETIDLSKVPGSTTLVRTSYTSYSGKAHYNPVYATTAQTAKILIRYGTVVYPITDQELIKLPHIPDYAWVIQAPADSLSLQPSRETLVFTETTKNTLKALEQNTLKLFNDVPGYTKNTMALLREKLKASMEPPKVDDNGVAIPPEQFDGLNSGYVIVGTVSYEELLKVLETHFSKFLSRTMLPASLSLATRKLESVSLKTATTILWKDLITLLLNEQGYSMGVARQLATRLLGAEQAPLHISRRMALPKQLRKIILQFRSLVEKGRASVKYPNGELELLDVRDVVSQLALLSKRVFITRLVSDLPSFNIRNTGVVLHTSSAKKAAAYEENFKAAGWEVINCWEAPERTKTTKKTKSVKISSPKLGHLSLAAGWTKRSSIDGWFNSIVALEAARQLDEDPKMTRVDAPIAYVQASTAYGKTSGDHLSTKLYYTAHNNVVLHEFAKQIALTVTKPQSEAMEKKGVPELSTYINKTLKHMDVNAQINFYAQVASRIFFETSFCRLGNGPKAAEVISQVFPSPDAAKAGNLGLCMMHYSSDPKIFPRYDPAYPLRLNLWVSGIDTAAIQARVRTLVPKAKKFIDVDAVMTAVLAGDLTFQEALTTYFE